MDDLCLKEIYDPVKKQIINLEINRNSFNNNILPLAYRGTHIRRYNRQKGTKHSLWILQRFVLLYCILLESQSLNVVPW
uniref:Uncharacterized protein n=1 Tax=Anguilla anguilla TaxID=7936 RepID=A0A0E9WW35_ANGAN